MVQHMLSLCSAYARAKKVKVGPEFARGLELGFGLVPGGVGTVRVPRIGIC
jgi:hypothetical protein